MARVVVVVPAKDCPAVLEMVKRVPFPTIVVDDGSRVAIPGALRHPKSRGYGAAQKTGYAAALEAGAERIVLLHGDGQYDVEGTLALAEALEDADAALGSRFLADPSVIPWWRRMGNRGLTGLANLRFGTSHTELHTGARAFRAETLRGLPLASYSDDYLFDQQVLCTMLARGMRIAERPVTVTYEGVQSIPLGRAVTYGVGCISTILGVKR